MLSRRAAQQPDSLAVEFTGDETRSLTYAELDARARAIAARLQREVVPGERVLLLYPPGLDYVTAFFGCLYANAVAVPAYPPNPLKLDRALPRLSAIVRDARPAVVLTDSLVHGMSDSLFAGAPECARMPWLVTDADLTDTAEDWREPEIRPGDIALLQYTSGSTGSPRGVLLAHGNLLHNSQLIHDYFGHSSQSRGVIWLPPYHDMGLIGGIIQPVFGGFPVTLMSPMDFLKEPVRWLREISRTGATTSGGPNFAYDLCVRKTTAEQRAQLDLSTWRVAFNGAEPIRPGTLDRFAEAFAPAGFLRDAFHPCYGLAEATLIVSGAGTGAPVHHPNGRTAEAELVGSGTGAPGQRLVVVDRATLTPCAPLAEGEIWLAGPSVAQGYWERPAESASTFAARLAGTGEGPFLRTGDLGFVADNGELVITGRIKDLIVVRGRNHYPQDIEATAEDSHPALRPGCGAAFAVDLEGEERLVIFHELIRDAQDTGHEEILSAVRQAVAAEHGVHVHDVVLLPAGHLPKTSSGKVQRHLCRSQYTESRTVLAPVEGAQPREGGTLQGQVTEARLRSLLAEACRLPESEIRADRPLLALGLDSLAAVSLQQAVSGEFGVDLSLASVLGGASLLDVVREVETAQSTAVVPTDRDQHASPVELPLSHGQRSLWVLQQLTPAGSAHIIALPIRLRGSLDVEALRRSVGVLADRHPMLSTVFPERDGEPVQLLSPDARPQFTVHDAHGLREEELSARLSDTAYRPFDLSSGPLLRFDVFRRSAEEAVVLLSVHHIVTDFWSMTTLVRELEALYAVGGDAARAALPHVEAGFEAVLARERDVLSGPQAEVLRAYWEDRLSGELPELRLPGPADASDAEQPVRGGVHTLTLSPALTDRIKACARAEAVTPFVLLLTAFQTVLHRWTGQNDIIVGTPTASRGRPEFEHVVGYCMNPVPIRTRLDGDTTFRDLLPQVRGQVVGALEHQEFPARLMARKHSAPDVGNALFRVMFVLNRSHRQGDGDVTLLAVGAPGARLRFAGLEAESVPLSPSESALDLELTVSEVEDAYSASLRYRTDVLAPQDAHRFAGHLMELLEDVTADPERPVSQLSLLTPPERAELLGSWNGSGCDGESALRVHQLFERQARTTPHADAVVGHGEQITYQELDHRANGLARTLRTLGAGPGTLVGVCCERSPALVAALLAVLKTGAAYVPVDPLYPAERIASVFEDSAVSLVMSDAGTAAKLPAHVTAVRVDEAHQPAAAPDEEDRVGKPSDTAYVIYTSGSTGKPKGVTVPHSALTNFTRFAVDHYGIGPDDRVLQFATVSFDASVEEIYPALAAGATVVLRDDDMLGSPAAFFAQVRDWGITVLDLPTAYWHELVDGLVRGDSPFPTSVRLTVIGGERVRPEQVTAWRKHSGDRSRLVNTYGPTEATVVATTAELSGSAALAGAPIGMPIANTRAHVLDKHGQLVPVGVPGELHLSGAGLATGYLNREELTHSLFVPDPFGPPGTRMYRTGDLVRRRSDGALEFLGRLDRQLKLRGFRIEPDEIETALRARPEVQDALVTAYATATGRALAAYVVPVPDAETDEFALRAHLSRLLPAYMVPAAFVVLDSWPLTPSRKVDLGALPSPAASAVRASPVHVAPVTAEEKLLAALWQEVLDVPGVGATDDFFALGGHSLLATKVLARVREATGRSVPLRAAFERPVLRDLAAALADSAGPSPMGAGVPDEPLHVVDRGGDLPLTFPQERIWFLQQLEPESTNYNVPRALRIRGSFDHAVLTQVFDALEKRHEILRTVFPSVDGRPVQQVHAARGFPIDVIDLSHLPHQDREERVHEEILRAGQQPFDLAVGPVMRLSLLRLGAEDHILVVVEHHLIHDGWAQGVFLRDFLELYAATAAGRAPQLPELTVQYADYAAWQRRAVSGERLRLLQDYWKDRMAGSPALLALPTDRPRPSRLGSDGDQEVLHIDAGLADALREFGRSNGGSLFMTMFAAFTVLLQRYSGQDDIVVGAGIANRSRPEAENLLGMFINTVLLRSDMSGDPAFLTLFEQVRETCLEAYAYQDMPFEKLVEVLHPERSASFSPLFQAMFSFLDTPMPSLRVPGLEFEVIDAHNRSAKFDLNMVLIPHAEQRTERGAPSSSEITVLLEYNTDLFEPASIQRMLSDYQEVLRAAVGNPETALSKIAGDAVSAPPRRVTVRGFLVDPLDVEETLVSHPAVRQAVVHAYDNGLQEPQLVAHVVLAGPDRDMDPDAPAATGEELRAHLQGLLAPHLVPTSVMVLAALPVGSDGTVDHAALPAPDDELEELWETAYTAPGTPVEEQLVELCQDVLDVDRIGVHDDFFELGMHSLLATRLIARVQDVYGIELPVRRVFESPTVAELALLVVETQAALTDEDELAELLKELE
ncbi:amino acid adenylation domain-containing protein [Streptomyces sp. NPDC008163]|uniref:amino acid adenylation domain-containing protein n=1 Tax=Streptomyces sp. NPDC008163 TaxID=3364818 RepID=UPI0036EF4A27